jgi:hypothetical protein
MQSCIPGVLQVTSKYLTAIILVHVQHFTGWESLMFMCPCITSVIINDNQQYAIINDLFIPSLLYMFRAIPSPIIKRT